MFTLVRDDDSHWYVIPVDKADEWYDLLDDESDDLPDWAVSVGGSPSRIVFDTYSFYGE